jgi:hypothetical protein
MAVERSATRIGGLLAAVVLAAACATAPRDPAADAGEAPPAPPLAPEATVRRIESRDDVRLRGPRVDAKKGDWLVQGRGGVAVVSATKGNVIDFGAEGGDDGLVALDPTVFIGLEQVTSVVESVGPAGPGGRALLVRKRMLSDPPLRLWSYVTFADGALRVESVATAAEQGSLAVVLGEVVAWGNVPTWVEGHGFVANRDKETLTGEFIAREALGVAYALSAEQGNVVARFPFPDPGFHESARTGERLESVPAFGSSVRRVVFVSQGHGRVGDAVRALPRFAAPLESRPMPRDIPPGTVVEVERCDRSPFARFDGASDSLALPPGCWRVRLTSPGHAPGDWFSPEALGAASPEVAFPRAGTLRWRVRERRSGAAADPTSVRPQAAGDAPLPARILLQGIGDTPDPDWGDDPVDGAALNVLHVDRDGERAVPPGRYHVTITRGFEYTTHESDIVVRPHAAAVIAAELERVVDTTGWISADLHVHALSSPDAPSPLPDRVRALAAAGVEVAVATDHNAITDYADAIRERGLGRFLASIVGDEVTTRGVLLGHFNVFPLGPGTPPIPYERVTPPAIVAAARAAAPPDPSRIVQLNHPRMGSIGYFDLARFDPRDVAAWRARSSLIETGFDAIEVFNGDDYAKPDEVMRVMRDWFALLDAGVRITATGNSDSHKLTYHECGVPRNLVRMADDDPARFDEKAFVLAVRRGQVVVSSGPVVWLEVAGHGVGETAPAGADEVHVTVDAPPWVDVSLVEVVRRGETIRTWTGPFPRATRRLDVRFETPLAKGDWVIAIARGERAMTFLPRLGAKPLSFTNPVFVE